LAFKQAMIIAFFQISWSAKEFYLILFSSEH